VAAAAAAAAAPARAATTTIAVPPPRGPLPAGEVAAAGWTPFRVVRLSRNGDELVLCVTDLRDRVCVYYPRERATELRAGNHMFPGVPVDDMKEELVTTIEEAEAEGVDCLADSAAVCADEYGARHDGVVFGAISAAVSSLDEEEEEVARYFALLHRDGEPPLYFFAHGCDAEAHQPAKFARSVGTSPIVHSDLLATRASATAAALHIRAHTEASELRQASESVSATAAKLRACLESSLAALAAFGDTLDRSLRMRARETARLVDDVIVIEEPAGTAAPADSDDETAAAAAPPPAPPPTVFEPALRRHVRRLCEFGSYASRLEEIVGTAASSAVAAAADVEAAIRSAAAEAFVETQAVFADATFQKRAASKWGIDASPSDDEMLAAVNFASIAKHLRVPAELCNGGAATTALRRVAVAAEHAVDIRRAGDV
jgi:hypothetical protein